VDTRDPDHRPGSTRPIGSLGAARRPATCLRADPPPGPWSAHPVALLVVIGVTLTVPLAVVSAILGHLPLRGAMLAGALLFVVAWIVLTIRSRPTSTFATDRWMHHTPVPHR